VSLFRQWTLRAQRDADDDGGIDMFVSPAVRFCLYPRAVA